MPRPTEEQLQRINRFAQVPRTAENTYVFENLMIDDQPTSYSSKIHPNLLNKFVQDAGRGVGLLMNHNSRTLPVGRSFGAHTKGELLEDGTFASTMYGEFYIPLGRKTESNMTTDDLAAGIDDGSIFDTSIGFSAHKWDCSICNNDIRNYRACDHFPGEKYAVNRDGIDQVETCYVIVGEDAKGELVENSLVYAGAAPRATITKSNFSVDSVSNFEDRSNLHVVENFKNIPEGTKIFSYYSKNGMSLYTETEDRTDGAQHLKQRSESQVVLEKLMQVLGQFGISAENEDALQAALAAATDKSEIEAQLTQATTDLEAAKGELATAATDLEATKEELATKTATIEELEQANQELSLKAGVAETYRQDLVDETIKSGVRVFGNKFQAELFTKFLSTLSIDEVKAQNEAFKAQFSENFAGVRTTETQSPVADRLNAPQTKDDFESEDEFRAFVADEAVKYAKENGVTISAATKLVYKKLTTKEDE